MVTFEWERMLTSIAFTMFYLIYARRLLNLCFYSSSLLAITLCQVQNFTEKMFCHIFFLIQYRYCGKRCNTRQRWEIIVQIFIKFFNSPLNFYSSFKAILLRPELMSVQKAGNSVLVYSTEIIILVGKISTANGYLCSFYGYKTYIPFFTLTDSVTNTPLSSHQNPPVILMIHTMYFT